MKSEMHTPLYTALRAILRRDRARFHMPGHKGHDRTGIFGGTLRYDITETDGADSLYRASGAILQAEGRIAAYYGARRSLLSPQGSTLGIQTMLSLARGRGRKLIIARGAHVAAANAISLLDFDPTWIYPAVDGKTGVTTPPAANAIEAALAENPDAAAVYVTSPTYYGVFADVAGIAAVCKKYGVPLLVDNAHGAHLIAAGYEHPIRQGAAICSDSAHKTLPALTGGAFVHIADEQFAAGAKDAMAVFGSTSPSYLIMLSLDACAAYLETNAAREFLALRQRVGELETLAANNGFYSIGGNRDHTRLLLCAHGLGYTGAHLAEHLARHGIEHEYAGERTVVLLASPQNTHRDFARLKRALTSIKPLGDPPEELLPEVHAVQAIAPREAFFAQKETVPLSQAEGRVAAQNRTSCPPGVPVAMCGERITADAVRRLAYYGFDRVTVVR